MENFDELLEIRQIRQYYQNFVPYGTAITTKDVSKI